MDLRYASKSDILGLLPLIEDVLGLHIEHMPEHFRHPGQSALIDHYQKRISGNCRLLMAENEEKPVGFLLWWYEHRAQTAFTHARQIGHLEEICVDKTMRGQGVGSALGTRAIKDMQTVGATEILVSHWYFNTASAALMKHLGFHTPHITLRQYAR